MEAIERTVLIVVAAALATAAHAAADMDRPTRAAGTVTAGGYPALTRGRVVLVNAQRLVVTQEPPPAAALSEPPPEPLVAEDETSRPLAPTSTAIWVAGHWVYGVGGFEWVAGRYIAARSGHAFVPPRWAVFEEQYLFFNGFFVPRGVFVRSHFNRYFFSGMPTTAAGTVQRIDRGPYWPVGAPTRSGQASTSAGARDPYWPVGAPTRANSPFKRAPAQAPFRPVGTTR